MTKWNPSTRLSLHPSIRLYDAMRCKHAVWPVSIKSWLTLRFLWKKSEKNNGPRRNARGFCWCVKSCCSHFKLVPCYSWSIISPYAKFDPNWTKNTQARNFHFWSILVGRAGRSKNGRRHIRLILCCFCPIISPYTKFHPNRTKNMEVRNFHFWSILVGRAGTRASNDH